MRIGVIGAGAWGTALAQVAALGDRPVLLWAREPEVAEAINDRHENSVFLPGIALAPSITATTALDDLAACDALLAVLPAQHLGAVLASVSVGTRPVVLCAKGIEAASGRLMSEVAAAAQPGARLAVLSGPTFAAEVARGLPTAATLACADADLGRALSDRLSAPAFRLYASSDVVGAEIGGAVKNVLAIACGIVAGLRLGENARAAVIARGFAEMLRFGVARGARAETLGGLSGLGDLVLTCSSRQSRNFSVGVQLGEGAGDAIGRGSSVAEGVFTAPVLQREAKRMGVAMPVVDAVCAVIAGDDVHAVVAALLARPPGDEV